MLDPRAVAPIQAHSTVDPMSQPAKPRIFLADDQYLLMESLSVLLAPEFDIVGVATPGQSIVEEMIRLEPDVIVLDITMAQVGGLDLCRTILETALHTKIVFLTMHTGRITVRDAFRAGASAYVVKSCSSRELVTALTTVHSGGTYISQELRESLSKPEAEELSERQIEVLRLVAQGFSAKQIAFHLNISSRTAEFHKRSIMGKLKLRTTAQLTRWAMEHGLSA